MSKAASRELFALVESFFTEYLPRQRGASRHTVCAYRDALKLLFEFLAQRAGRAIVSLQLSDLDADAIASFLDHIELSRSNSAATRNCRRAALRSFFKHLVRNDIVHSLQYTRVLAIPSKKTRQKPATYLEAQGSPHFQIAPNISVNTGWAFITSANFSTNGSRRCSGMVGMSW
jgi:site-specific recombinase XerD